jgi:hypothetical protein
MPEVTYTAHADEQPRAYSVLYRGAAAAGLTSVPAEMGVGGIQDTCCTTEAACRL